MQTLQDYLLENIDEGKIWNSIKDWFKNFFSDSSDQIYNRYGKGNTKIAGANLVNYKNYLDENFSIDHIDIKKFTKKLLRKAVYPGDINPSKEENIGFYEFIDDKYNEDHNYYGLLYIDDKVRDTCCIIETRYSDMHLTTEILKLQVLTEFEKYLPIKRVINILLNDKNFKQTNSRFLIVDKKVNKNLYNQVINDCDFKRETKHGENIATLKIQ